MSLHCCLRTLKYILQVSHQPSRKMERFLCRVPSHDLHLLPLYSLLSLLLSGSVKDCLGCGMITTEKQCSPLILKLPLWLPLASSLYFPPCMLALCPTQNHGGQTCLLELQADRAQLQALPLTPCPPKVLALFYLAALVPCSHQFEFCLCFCAPGAYPPPLPSTLITFHSVLHQL